MNSADANTLALLWGQAIALALHPEKEATVPACSCPENAAYAEDCVDCPEHGADASAELEAIHKSEIDAEYAWLRAAEAKTAEDYAFEQWEAERGCF